MNPEPLGWYMDKRQHLAETFGTVPVFLIAQGAPRCTAIMPLASKCAGPAEKLQSNQPFYQKKNCLMWSCRPPGEHIA